MTCQAGPFWGPFLRNSVHVCVVCMLCMLCVCVEGGCWGISYKCGSFFFILLLPSSCAWVEHNPGVMDVVAQVGTESGERGFTISSTLKMTWTTTAFWGRTLNDNWKSWTWWFRIALPARGGVIYQEFITNYAVHTVQGWPGPGVASTGSFLIGTRTGGKPLLIRWSLAAPQLSPLSWFCFLG